MADPGGAYDSRREQRRADFLAQTARIPFLELQRYFAAGKLVAVADELDLIDVAVALAEDDTQRFKDWLHCGGVALADDALASRWLGEERSLWAVVADPWVLVQERGASFPPDQSGEAS